MRAGRTATIGILGIAAMLLAGCDDRQNLWRAKTDDIRVFITPFPCTAFSGKVPVDNTNSIFYEMLGSQWWTSNDACRGAIVCPPSSWAMPSDRYARRITFINQQGVVQDIKAWVTGQTDMMPLSANMAAKHN